MKKTYGLPFLLILFLSATIIMGCSAANNNEETDANNETNENNNDMNVTENTDGSDYPITLDNAGRELTFEQAPERVFGLYQQEAELFAALDLEDKLVGYSIATANTPPEYEEKLADVPVIGENNYPSKEVLLESDPDFVIGSERSFNKNGVGTVEDFDALDIHAYVTESEKPETVENMVYKQIRDIAEIFDVEERGEALIESMQDEIDEITSHVAEVDEPVKVLLMSGGESGSAQVSGGLSLDSHLIELAGGENIFADEDEYLLEVSWEEIVDRDPDVIVTSYCCGTTPDDLETMLVNNESLEDVTAIKENRFIAAQVEDTTGNVRIIQGLKILAEGFYPERFE